MQYNKQWFLEFFKNIPDDKWVRGVLETRAGCKCMLGHLGLKDYDFNSMEPEVRERFNALINLIHCNAYDWAPIYSINDNIENWDYETQGIPPSEVIKQNVISHIEKLSD